MPRKQKRRGRRVTAGTRLERHRKASDLMPASYGRNLPGGPPVACLFTSFFPDVVRLFMPFTSR